MEGKIAACLFVGECVVVVVVVGVCVALNSMRTKCESIWWVHTTRQMGHLQSRAGGGVRLIDRRLRSLSLRFLSFFFFFFSGVAGVGGDSGSSIGDALPVLCTRDGDSYDAEREWRRCFFFFGFFRLSLDELMVLIERCSRGN